MASQAVRQVVSMPPGAYIFATFDVHWKGAEAPASADALDIKVETYPVVALTYWASPALYGTERRLDVSPVFLDGYGRLEEGVLDYPSFHGVGALGLPLGMFPATLGSDVLEERARLMGWEWITRWRIQQELAARREAQQHDAERQGES
jgi:hypothetical protein